MVNTQYLIAGKVQDSPSWSFPASGYISACELHTEAVRGTAPKNLN